MALVACKDAPPPAAPAAAPPTTPPVEAPATLPPMSADPTAANAACADCHPDEVASFAATGMGRSLAPGKDAEVIEDYEKAEVTHAASGFVYRATRDADGRLWQEERVVGDAGWVRRIEAKYIIGSGNHTRSYLGEVDGQLVQLPLTWYSRRQIWDLSPGYDQAGQPRFGRLVEAPCLFCHNGLTPELGGIPARFRDPLAHGIGCDRCHGDGAAHVAERAAGKGPAAGTPDPSIFNPGRESPERQLQTCQQCHLQADASVIHAGQRWDRYDPRLPLARYLSVFRRAGDEGTAFTIDSHGRRLALSDCAQRREGRLACTSCHNPHTTATDETHRNACLSCHGEGAAGGAKLHCSDAAAASPEMPCHRCHMAAGDAADVPHVKFTDHFIRKKPGADGRPPEDRKTTSLVDLVSGAAPLDGLDARLRVGLAHTFLWERQHHPEHLAEAVSTLEAVLREAPDALAGRATGWAALGRAYQQQGRPAEAVQAFERARALDIDDPRFPEDYSAALAAAGKIEDARAALQAALARFPTADRWMRLGMLHLREGHLPAARAAFESAAGLTTANPAPPTELAALLVREGDQVGARKALGEALQRDITHGPALLRLGLLDLQTERPAEAAAHLDRLLAREPQAVPGWLLRAQARGKLGRIDDALADYAKLRELAPGRPEGYVEAARLALAHGRKADATALLTAAAGRFPRDPNVAALLQTLQP
ncbi:MAG: tetratricopeptide repeat protein [bacterium]